VAGNPLNNLSPLPVLAGAANADPRRLPLRIWLNGQELRACEGQTVAAVLMASGCRAFRRTARRGEPRGLFCGMGICFDCVVRIDDRPNVRACQTPVRDGMRVSTQQGEGP
jgi:predicted molibdopterin-dependent oxidoreductase YjgC